MKVAVYGMGSIGTRHATVLSEFQQECVRAIPLRPRPAPGFTTLPDLDAAREWGATLVIVATDTSRHVADSVAAIENGFDVLVEKPVAVDSEQARHLWMEAGRLHRRVYVGCTLRFSDSLAKFRVLLNRIGRLHQVRIECQSFLPDWRPQRPYKESYSARAGEGGVLRDLIHEIDYASWIFGWPSTVQARVRNIGRIGIEADEACDLNWELANGCLVSTALDYLTRPGHRWMRAFGEAGTLIWDGFRDTVTIAAGSGEETFQFNQTRNDMVLKQDLAFTAACEGKVDPRLATCEDGFRALAICDAARRASSLRSEQEVRYQ